VRADLGARRQRHESLIEVETPEPEKSKRKEKQKRIFKQWSEKSEHRDFKRISANEYIRKSSGR